MKTPRPLSAVALAEKLNPIIGFSAPDTLHNAACVASFLARLQFDRSEAFFLAEEHNPAWAPYPLTGNETRGLGFVTEALAAALWFEAEGRQAAEGGQS